MFIFYRELNLKDGFCVLNKSRTKQIVYGQRVSSPSGVLLWKHLWNQNKPIKCWCCGIEADRFIVKHHPKDMEKPPVLELFAYTGNVLRMMTRDHIIPASLGGVNDVENLRPGCDRCNNRRKNTMNAEDQKFMDTHPHLIRKEIYGNR